MLIICHNDLNLTNILINNKNQILLIDYEYSNLNPVYYEIANFLLELRFQYFNTKPYFAY